MHAGDRPGAAAPLRVLVVEDSTFFRTQLVRLLTADGDIEVVGQAVNGAEAVVKAKALLPDLITMDVEMPVMDGISAVREIMRQSPTRILMLSSFTREGAEATLGALEAGALDFIQKRAITADTLASVGHVVRTKVREIVRNGRAPAALRKPGAASLQALAGPPDGMQPRQAEPGTPAPWADAGVARTAAPRPSQAPEALAPRATGEPGWFTGCPLLVLGASTGGPVVLGELLGAIPASFPCPILVAVHIPGSFSRFFAERLNARCAWTVEEAASGARLVPGRVLVAPGGQQTRVVRAGSALAVEVEPGPAELLYKPSIDYTLSSVASVVGRGALAVVLTGMGNDGTQGARALSAAGGTVWAQDESSSVVFGMPASVIKAGLASEVLSISGLAARLARGR